MRLWLPESPRWLMTHGRADEAERVVAGIERRVFGGDAPPPADAAAGAAARAHAHAAGGGGRTRLLHRHRRRALVGLALMARAGVLLQRDLLHLRAGADRLLRHPGEPGRLVHPAVRGRQFPRAAAARPAVRRDRPPADDRLHLHHVGRAAGGQRLPVRAGRAQRRAADAGLDGDLLLRLGRGKLGLSHGQRDLPAGDPRAGHRRSSTRSAPASAAWPGRGCSAR